jgi:hypothetical protein
MVNSHNAPEGIVAVKEVKSHVVQESRGGKNGQEVQSRPMDLLEQHKPLVSQTALSEEC